MLDFVIIGAQKSASTFLQDCLADHPQVRMPLGESRHFEDPHYDDAAVAELAATLGPPDTAIRRGIKRPDYLARDRIPERIARHAPDARLLVVLRDPVPRAMSAYYHYVRLGFAPLDAPDRAFARIFDGSMQRSHPRAAEIIDFGMYGAHLTRWLSVFRRDRLLVLLQDDLGSDPTREIHRAYRFLGIDTEHRAGPDGPSFRRSTRSNTSVYAPWRLRLLRTRNHRLFRYTPTVDRREPRRPSPGGYVWSAAVTALDRSVLARLDDRPAPTLSPDVVSRLRATYAPDRVLLEPLLDRPLPWPAS